MGNLLFLRLLEGTIPSIAFLVIFCSLLEPKCSPGAARGVLAGFLMAELALQSTVLALSDSPELLFTLLPLTLCLPAILTGHLISALSFVPTAVSWILALLCQHLLMIFQKLLLSNTTLSETVRPWVAVGLLLLGAAALTAAVFRFFRRPFQSSAQELEGNWVPLLLLPVILLALHSYFLSDATVPAVLLLLMSAALAAFWVLARLMTALAAEAQARQSRLQMAALRQDYELLQKKLELGRNHRHDMRHHILALSTLLQQGDLEAALNYVSDWQGQLSQVETRSWCHSAPVNAVLSAYLTQAEEAGCTLEIKVSLPPEIPVEELDLCVALANALENAIHACQAAPEDQRRIRLELALADHRRLTLHVENTCAQPVEIGQDGFPVTEHREGHGQGLKSIATVAEKYHGMFQCSYSEGLFTLRTVLLDPGTEPRRVRWIPAVCAGVLLTLFLLNCMPALAQALEAVPVLGRAVRVVDSHSYAWLWGGTGLSGQTPVLDGDPQAVDQVKEKQEEFIEQMKESFLFQVARKYQGYVAEDIRYEVMRDDEALFILRFDATLNAGGSVDYHCHIVLDKQTGQVLKLADLFQSDVNFVFPISREIKAQMEEQMKNGGGNYFLPGGIWSEEECFQSIDPEGQDFYINESGQLVIAFAEYEVAPGFMGSPEFVIPTDILSGLLAQPSPLKGEG